MRILKNSLYIQEKKKNLSKDTLFSFYKEYRNLVLNHINVDNIKTTIFPYSITNQNISKKNKKYKKILFLSLINLMLKKIIFYTLHYKKITNLLENWILNNYTQYITYLSKKKFLNNKTILFYIKNKCVSLLSIIEKIKYNYVTQFLITFFKVNKKIRIFLDLQNDMDSVKSRNIMNIIQKVRNIMYNNLNLDIKNKTFLNDIIIINKSIKKEIINNFFLKKENNIKINSKKKNIEIEKTDSAFFDLFIKYNFKISYKKLKQIINKFKFNTLDQVYMYSLNTRGSLLYKIITEKNEKKINIIKWIVLNKIIELSTINYSKIIFNFLKNNNEITKKKTIYNLKITTTKNYLLFLNTIPHLMNNKNTKPIFINYYTQLNLIINTIELNYSWFTMIEHKKRLIDNIYTTRRKKLKKGINALFNTIINQSNKKFGITYNCMLLNDSLSYWTKDYNIQDKKVTHLQNITEIQKTNYKFTIIKYSNNLRNSNAYIKSKLDNYTNYIKNTIKQNEYTYSHNNVNINLRVL